MSAEVIGGSVASGNNEITSLSDLPEGSLPTESQMRAALARLEVQILNLTTGNGTYGSADYEERGDVGFRIENSRTLQGLLEYRKQLVDALSNPVLLGDWELFLSQWDEEYI